MAAEVRVPQPIAALLSGYGLSGEGLARAVGLAERAVQRVIEGADLPTAEFAARVAQYLSAPEDALFLPERRPGKYRARPCRSCGAEFVRIAPNHVYCTSCRPRRAR